MFDDIDSAAQRALMYMVSVGFTCDDLELIPHALALPIMQALHSCKENLSSNLPLNALKLLGTCNVFIKCDCCMLPRERWHISAYQLYPCSCGTIYSIFKPSTLLLLYLIWLSDAPLYSLLSLILIGPNCKIHHGRTRTTYNIYDQFGNLVLQPIPPILIPYPSILSIFLT